MWYGNATQSGAKLEQPISRTLLGLFKIRLLFHTRVRSQNFKNQQKFSPPAIFLLPHTVTMLPLVRENFKKICAEAGLLDLFVWQIHESCFCKNLRDFNLHWEDGSLGAKKRPNRWGNMSVEPWALSEYNILQHYVTNSIIFDTRYSTCSGFYNFLTQQN